jgi:UDP-N-acetylmuramate--alanine ligase
VVFQPHRYTRTKALMEEFIHAFEDADTLCILDIYAASEKPIDGVSGEALAVRIREETGRDVRYVRSFAEVAEIVSAEAREGDMIMTLGAGSVSQLGPMIVEKLQARQVVSVSTG